MVAHQRKAESKYSITENGVPFATMVGVAMMPGIKTDIQFAGVDRGREGNICEISTDNRQGLFVLFYCDFT